MNQRDQDNLSFLLSLNSDSLLAWYNQASEDDILYAQELLDNYEFQLNLEENGVAFMQQSVSVH